MDETTSLKSGSPALTAGSGGIKRKKAGEPKFYAVRLGHTPGIYHTWDDCLKQVTGFKGATFKSFPSLTDAERFLAGDNTAGAGAENKFYAVKSGRVPGIYTDWASASEQIRGWTKPRHKLFQTRAEAQQFLDEDDGRSSKAQETIETDAAAAEEMLTADDPTTAGSKPPPAKKAKKVITGASKATKSAPAEYNEADFEPGTAPLPGDAEDGFDPNVILDAEAVKVVYKSQEQRQATKRVDNGNWQTGPVRIHTDGSSLGNGKEGAFAGVGVYFGPNDPRNISETLPGTRQTNQRAELTAILRALEIVPRTRDCQIITDSQYGINCVTLWYTNWRRNGWKTSNGKPVENKDLVENILTRIEERQTINVRTDFEWIKGHANNSGNVEADKLAVDGARKAVYA